MLLLVALQIITETAKLWRATGRVTIYEKCCEIFQVAVLKEGADK